MMQHSLNKEASELLCDAIQCRIQDGDAPQDEWFDSKGSAIPPNRFCIYADTEEQPDDHDGPCMGIKVNIWERAKKRRHLVHHFSGGGGSFYGGDDALNHMLILHGNAGKLGEYPILSKLPDKSSSPDFCTSSTIFTFKGWR